MSNIYNNKDDTIEYNGIEISNYMFKVLQSMQLEEIIKTQQCFYSIDHILYYFQKVLNVKLSNATISRRLNSIDNLVKITVAPRVEYFSLDETGLYDTKNYKINRRNEYISVNRIYNKNPNFELLRHKKYYNDDLVSLALEKIENEIITACENNQNEVRIYDIFQDQNILVINHKHNDYKPIYEAQVIIKFLKRQKFKVEHIKNNNDSYLHIMW